jgi:DNA-3-methyladenine glycosylase II
MEEDMKLKTTNNIMNYLKNKDEEFSIFEKKYGLIEYDLYDDVFESVVLNIVGQMLSNKAASKIYERLVKICNGKITAENINKVDSEDMRKCGISYSKINYIKEFALRYSNNEYDFSNIIDMTDEEVIKKLREIKGVGLWTAEMLALFTLGRENIFSYDDVALRNGIMKAKGYKTLSKKRFEGLRKKYTPYCSFASLYFYRINDDK